MLAVTSDKALLRAVWELVADEPEQSRVSLSEVAARLNGTAAASDSLELDAELLQELGLLCLSRRNGGREVELTQVGAFLATRLLLPE